jgi:uncharacterized protein (TIGR03086 family)
MSTSLTTSRSIDTGVPAIGRHKRAISAVDALINQIQPDQWSLPTPCSDWDLRALVEHLIIEARWTPPLLSGLTIDEVGATLDEPLDPDPLRAWASAKAAAEDAARGPQIGEIVVHLSSGDTPAQEYLRQLTADYLVHGWDLAVTLGLDDALDPELVSAVGGWFPAHAAAYRSAGMISRVEAPTGGDPQTRLLAQFGRERVSEATRAAVARFGLAFDRGDVDAVMAAMTTDCVFESTAPPDGQRHEGQTEVRQAWTRFFAQSDTARFETEEIVVADDRAIVRWRYTWAPDPAGHVRGVDVFRVRDGVVAEKLSYVKG